ncbi:MAG: 4-alpha-glucanotransferase [Firmicutes bacterium HGW-Firmicutes-1]|jgi:4-alpha-glucanotransferase|nr:MAG: 4-alpha-glucanotransferase [Firmicutes bacterium HGW-Firmicutes-1]
MQGRTSGILLHISSLPNQYGIGTFGKEAYEFVDFLKQSGQSYWQLLPLVHTGFGNSPYQGYSTFAGNPLFINYEILEEEGVLDQDDYKTLDYCDETSKVNFEKVERINLIVLRKAFSKINATIKKEISEFENEHHWLHNYSEFMAIKIKNKNIQWQDWPAELKFRKEVALEEIRVELKEEIEFWKFVQFTFFKQWNKLKNYANKNNIKIIGDIPIYVSTDSSDTWANRDIFNFDINCMPKTVAGCPPDAFSKTGQLWGNPIYNWGVLERQGFKWWIERIEGCMELYDVIRIDHFRGLESYWDIPFGDETAKDGMWVKGPGMKLIHAIETNIKNVDIIAEDLGYLTDDVIKLLKDSGYPGMKVLQFAFDSREVSDYLPHNYDKNCIAYTGTHDNDTVMGWMVNADKKDVTKAIAYLKLDETEGYSWGFIRAAWSTVAKLAVAPMQDFLGLDTSARMNIPSTIGNNWEWRLTKDQIHEALSLRIYTMTKLYGRLEENV